MAGPSHVDLSVLWVPIMPETSKLGPAMEEAGKDATESFDKGTVGLGDKIHDSFTKATGKVKDVFHKAGGDASESMADGVTKSSKKVEDALEDTGKKAGGKFSDAVKDMLPESLSKGGSKLDGLAEKLGTEIGARLGTGIGDQLEKLDGYAKTVGIDISGWTGPAKDAAGNFSTLKDDAKVFASQITDVTSNFEGMPGKVGKVGKAIGDLAIPLSMVEQALEKINDLFDKAGGKRKWDDVVNPSDPNAGQGFWDKAGRLFQSWAPGGTFDKGPAPAGPPPGGFWGYGASNPGNLAPFFPGIPGGAPPAHGDRQLPQGGWFGGGGHPAGFPPRDVGSDKGLTPTSSEVKKTISTLFPQINDIGGWRPPDGFNEHSSGQALDVMIPGAGTPAGKALGDQIRDYVMKNAKSLGVDYALWQQTQWNPDGSHSGMENRGSPTQNHMDHVHIHTTRGGGDGTMPTDGPSSSLSSRGSSGGLGSSGGGGIPTGAQHDPLYIMPADSGGSGGGSSQDQAQQLGSGFLDGLMQSVGLDGSVFKGFGGSSNPLHFGITKLATGLISTFAGGAQGGGGAAGGGGGIPGLGALGSLIPSAAHGVVPTGPGGAQNVRTGETQNSTNHYYGNTGPTLNVTQTGQSPTQDLHETLNGAQNRMPAMGTTNNSGNVPH